MPSHFIYGCQNEVLNKLKEQMDKGNQVLGQKMQLEDEERKKETVKKMKCKQEKDRLVKLR